MTVEEKLRELAQRTEEHQAPITAEEVVARASGQDGLRLVEGRGGAPWRHSRHWLLAVAALVVVASLGFWGAGRDEGAQDIRTGPDLPTPPPGVIGNGLILFTADSAGGDALTDPLDHRTAETRPQPMDPYVATDDEPVRRVLDTDTVERCPTFSPDGGRLAYVEAPESNPDDDSRVVPSIVVVPVADGGEVGPEALRQPLLPVASNHLQRSLGQVPCPVWSPDGTRLAYLAVLPDEEVAPLLVPGAHSQHFAELHVLTLQGDDRVVNAEALAYQDGRFAWSPDGDAIAYPAADGARIASLDGSAPILALATDTTPVWDTGESFGMPMATMATAVAWPTPGQLAVTILTSTLEYTDQSLHLVEVATGDDRVLEVTGDELQGVVAFSPDGSRLAYVLGDGSGALGIVDVSTGATIGLPPVLEDGTELRFRLVGWSPDGEQLLGFADEADLGSALVSVPAAPGFFELLTPWSWAFEFTHVREVSWQPRTGGA